MNSSATKRTSRRSNLRRTARSSSGVYSWKLATEPGLKARRLPPTRGSSASASASASHIALAPPPTRRLSSLSRSSYVSLPPTADRRSSSSLSSRVNSALVWAKDSAARPGSGWVMSKWAEVRGVSKGDVGRRTAEVGIFEEAAKDQIRRGLRVRAVQFGSWRMHPRLA